MTNKPVSFNIKTLLFAVGLWLLLTIWEAIGHSLVVQYTEKTEWKYIILGNLILMAYSGFCVFLQSKKSLLTYLPLLLLPYALTLMEFINFPIRECLAHDTISPMFFYAECYHFFIFPMILCCLFLFASHKSKKWTTVQIVLEIIAFSFCILVIANVLVTGAGLEDDAIVAICQTHPQEAWYYFWYENHGALLLLAAAVVCGLCSYAIIKCHKRAHADMIFHLRETGCIAAAIVILLGLGWKANMFTYFKPWSWRTFVNVPIGYFKNIKEYNQLIQNRTQLINELTQSINTNAKGRDGLFVLIIGESLNRHYMSCYSYEKNTTPFQQTFRQSSDFLFYDKIYSCHVQTAKTVPLILTGENQYLDNAEKQEQKRILSLIDIAGALNYQTIWISNQKKALSTSNMIDAIASQAQHCVYLSEKKDKDQHFDADILAELEQLTISNRCLLIIHLAGSHYPYAGHCPADFPYPDGLSDYEKSVFYNDFVLNRLVDFLQKRNASVIVHLSDHSEGVSSHIGHDSRPAFFTREMLDIPLWTYLSKDYQTAEPELTARVKQSTARIITNDLMFNYMLDLMKIGWDTTQSQRYSPLSEDFVLNKTAPRTIEGTRDITRYNEPDYIEVKK